MCGASIQGHKAGPSLSPAGGVGRAQAGFCTRNFQKIKVTVSK